MENQKKTPSQILFGSDYPFSLEPVTPNLIKRLQNYRGFNTNTRKAIEQDNAHLLFPRLNRG